MEKAAGRACAQAGGRGRGAWHGQCIDDAVVPRNAVEADPNSKETAMSVQKSAPTVTTNPIPQPVAPAPAGTPGAQGESASIPGAAVASQTTKPLQRQEGPLGSRGETGAPDHYSAHEPERRDSAETAPSPPRPSGSRRAGGVFGERKPPSGPPAAASGGPLGKIPGESRSPVAEGPAATGTSGVGRATGAGSSTLDPGFTEVGPVTIRGHVFSPEWAEHTLFGAIADHGRSKSWDSFIHDEHSTRAGIAHFTPPQKLHEHMSGEQMERYFGGDADELRRTNPEQWREGMERFLASPESHAVQVRTWFDVVGGSLEASLDHGWATDRSLAIAAGISNSLGSGGFQRLAAANNWDAEATLQAFVRPNGEPSAHFQRRADRIDREFPR